MKKSEIEKIEYGDWPLPENALTELGRMHAIWSSMENTLLLNIGKLAGFNDLYDVTPQILLNNLTFQQKLDIFSSLCNHLSNTYPNLSSYKKVISQLKSAQKLRNTFTHQSIIYDHETEVLKLAKSSNYGILKTSVEKIDITEIKRAIIAIDEANTAMYGLIVERKMKPVYQRRFEKNKEV